MKWFLSAAFLVALYGFVLVLCFSSNTVLLALSGLILFVFSIINIVFSIKLAIATQDIAKVRNEMRKVMLFIKLLCIPFFVFNFMLWVGFIGMLSIFPGGFLVWTFVPVIVFVTFFILLVTSSFSLSTIILYGRSKILNKAEIIIHALLQLVFVLDIIDTIILFNVIGRKNINKNTLSS